MIQSLLYITYIDMDSLPKTASSVRPQKIYQELKKSNIQIKLLEGQDNLYEKRKANVKEILKWLENNRPDMCYIESPSGPFLCPYDLKLLKVLNKKNIPTSIFYRDAYWKFPYMGIRRKSIYNSLKNRIVRYMQKRDWRVIVDTCTLIYFPSESLANYFKIKNFKTLPPGCEMADDNVMNTKNDKCPTAIYVGGATKRYGIYLILDTFKRLNDTEIQSKLKVICPKEQWECLDIEYQKYLDNDWLEVYHTADRKKLKELYQDSDFALLPLLKSEYNDIAVPVKLYEYVSYLKPVISTNCCEMKKIVTQNEIGIVTGDTSEEFEQAVRTMISNKKQFIEYKNNCFYMRKNNTWSKRVETIVEDLTNK